MECKKKRKVHMFFLKCPVLNDFADGGNGKLVSLTCGI
jgi:hypothetical protein